MNTYAPAQQITITANSAITNKRFVDFNSDPCAAGTKSLGVADDDAAAGEILSLVTLGVAIVEAGAAITKGSAVESAAGGKAITKSTGTLNGYALDAATQAGDFIRVFLR